MTNKLFDRVVIYYTAGGRVICMLNGPQSLVETLLLSNGRPRDASIIVGWDDEPDIVLELVEQELAAGLRSFDISQEGSMLVTPLKTPFIKKPARPRPSLKAVQKLAPNLPKGRDHRAKGGHPRFR